MEIVSERVLEDGSVQVMLAGDGIDKLPAFDSSHAPERGVTMRCGGHCWAVLSVSHPDPEGGIRVARAVLRGVTRPRAGMILRNGSDPIAPEEIATAVEALTHLYKICRSVDGARITNAIQDWRSKNPDQSRDSSMVAFLKLSAMANLVNATLDEDPFIESLIGSWESVAQKLRSMVLAS